MGVDAIRKDIIDINTSPEFIKHAYIPNADFYFHLTATFPLIMWYILVNKIYYYIFINDSNDMLVGYIELLIIILVPTIFILLPTIYSLTGIGNTIREKASIADLAPDWPLCFNSAITPKHPDGAIGTWDYKCSTIQTANNRSNIEQLSQRFYYLNFGLFMLILLLQKNFQIGVINKWVKRDTGLKYKILAIPLLIGLIGSISPVYQEFFLYSYWFVEVFSAFLTLNIMSFVILLYLLIKSKILHV